MRKLYHQIDNISGSVVTLRAEGVRNKELAEIDSRVGTSLAQVIKLAGDEVTLQVFAGARGVATDAQVRFLGHPMQVPFGDELLGRVFTGSAKPRDNGPELTMSPTDIGTPSVNPAKRIIPRHMVRTGIPMIDVFNTLVESQKLPIFARAGEPYNELLARIALQAEVDVIVLGGMGLKHDDYLAFRDTLDASGALSRTVMFVHTAADPVVECMLVPDVSLAVAEQFALKGKRVLVLLTDMTSFADALKEIAITMEQIPSNRGYPGDLYSQLAARYEKAVDFEGAGSITILAVTTMPGDDVTHPRARQHRLHHRGPVLSPQRPYRALRLALPPEAAGEQGHPRGSPHHHGRDDQALRAVQGRRREAIHGLPHERLGQEAPALWRALRGEDDGSLRQHPLGAGA